MKQIGLKIIIKNAMKSLTVLNIMLGKSLGGIEQAFVDYLIAFDNLNHKSVGIISKAARIKKKIPPHIKIKKIFNFGEWDIFASMRLKKIINKLQPNIIITHGRRAAKLVKPVAKKIPVIGITHNYSLDYLLELNYIFATTQHLTIQLTNLGYDPAKIFHVPNMINLNSTKIHTKPLQVKFRKPPVIGAMGRFVKKKGFDIFIKALSILKDEGIKFHAVIAGDGEEKPHLKELVETLHLTEIISFPGWIINKENFLSSIDIFCLPSTHEPFGIVLLEALLHSKPTVSFKSEGPSEIGTDNKDLLFAELGNERDLAEKIKLLLSKKSLAFKLATAGNILIKEKYSLDVIQNSLDRFIKQINSYAIAEVNN